MLYAILAYHVEAHVMSWTAAEDAALMAKLNRVHDHLTKEGQLEPAARLDTTRKARTLRGPGDGLVLDGPFAETKEQLLGFYLLDCENLDEAIEWVTQMPNAVDGAIEIRPIFPG